MKKILFALLMFLIISCSGDDNDDQNASFINPPNWIIGTWQDETLPEIGRIGGFTFANDNLISLTSSGETLINLKEGLQEGIDAGVISTNEIITDTVYELEIITTGAVTNQFMFTRGTDSETIIYDLSELFDVPLTRQ